VCHKSLNNTNSASLAASPDPTARCENGDLLVDQGHHHHETNGQQNQTLAHQHLPKPTAFVCSQLLRMQKRLMEIVAT